MDNPLLKYSAKEYFFKAALCHFIVDELNAKVSYPKIPDPSSAVAEILDVLLPRWIPGGCFPKSEDGKANPGEKKGMVCERISSLFQLALEKYEEMFPAFTDSRECKLLKVSNQGNFPLFHGFSPFSQHFRGHHPGFGPDPHLWWVLCSLG